MTQISEGALRDLKERNPIEKIAAKYVALRKKGGNLVGPCPLCSIDRKKKSASKFEVKVKIQRWMCAACCEGGDVIALVMKVEHLDFMAAVDRLGGAIEPDPEEIKRKDDEHRAAQEKRERTEREFRERERGKLYTTWTQYAQPAKDSEAVAAYLAGRGLADAPVDRLKFIANYPYYATGAKDAEAIHRGPAMLAAFTKGGKFAGLHMTYLDRAQPGGKLKLTHEGEPLPAKKMRGSKAGAAIHLAGPSSPTRLVVGEGIETTLSAFAAENHQSYDRVIPPTAYWAAGDLGNIGGRAAETVPHPYIKSDQGRTRRIPGPVPDLDGPGLEIPDSVTELVLLGDGDSDPVTTRCAMARACVRYARPGRVVRVAMAPEGQDFNDLWRDSRDAAAVCALIDAARPMKAEDALSPAPPRDSAARARHDDGAAEGGDHVGSSSTLVIDPEPPPDDAPPPAAPPPAAAGTFSDENEGQPARVSRPGARSANRARWGGPPRKYGDGEDALNRWLAFFPMTELGLIERYVQRWKGRLVYCPALGWLAWDGRRWSRDGAEGKARAAGHDTVRMLQAEAASIRGTEHDVIVDVKSVGKGKEKEEIEIYLSDKLEDFGRQSETKARMSLASDASAYLSVEIDELDADPFAINLLNGTLVVRRTPDEPLPAGWMRVGKFMRLKPHAPEDYITKLIPVAFDPKATCPRYDQFMVDVQPDEGVREFLDDWDGYALTGDATEQRLVFHYGTGKNGKSTYFSVRLAIAGDYGRSIPIETFINEKGKSRSAGQASPDLAMLRRIRNLVTSEPEKGWRLNEALIKALTGGDEVPVRELNKPYFMLKPEFKLSIAGNHKPNIGGGEAESGMWRRLVLVNWAIRITKEQQDPNLVEKLKGELPGILNRWLRGLQRWLDRGLKLPKDIVEATEQFRVDSDPLGRWFDECCVRDPAEAAGTTPAFELFKAWCRANGEREWSHTGFGRAMADRGFIKRKSSSWFWMGIKLTKSVSDFIDQHGNVVGESPSSAPRMADKGGHGDADDDISF